MAECPERNEMKPVRCGCGGEAKVDWVLQPDGVYMTGVYCENCGTKTIPFWSMKKDKAIDYAVTTWNRAMGNDYKSKSVERTAKVIKHKYWLGVSLNVVGEQTIGYEWLCENCKKKVIDGEDYCSHCGAKLDWGGYE